MAYISFHLNWLNATERALNELRNNKIPKIYSRKKNKKRQTKFKNSTEIIFFFIFQ